MKSLKSCLLLIPLAITLSACDFNPFGMFSSDESSTTSQISTTSSETSSSKPTSTGTTGTSINSTSSDESTTYVTTDESSSVGSTDTTQVTSSVASSEFEDHDGIAVTKLPYSLNGITISYISISKNSLTGLSATVIATNYNSFAISSLSNVAYKCYDSSNTVVKSASFFLEDLKSKESCSVEVFLTDNTAKLVFGDVKVYQDNSSTSGSAEFETVNGILVNKLPYSSNGIIINSISFSNDLLGKKATINVKNNNSYAISSLSNISYKCYNNSGTVIKTSAVFLEDMTSKENCDVHFYLEDNTTKLEFSDFDVYQDETGGASASGSFTTISGISVTSVPYTSNKITVNKITISSSTLFWKEVTLNVTNNNSFAVTSLSNIDYKCYNSKGTVIKSGSTFLENISSGESCNATFYLDEGTTKVVLGQATVYEDKSGGTTSSGSFTTVNGISVTKFPYTSNGIYVKSVSINKGGLLGTEAKLTISNNTGYAITGLSNIAYKCYNSSGTTVKSGSVTTQGLLHGESCYSSFYLTDDTTKLVLGEATAYKDDTGGVSKSSQTETISGITITKLPYSSNNIVVNSATIDKNGLLGPQVKLNVTNKNSYAISSTSKIPYKCYDSSGMVAKTGSVFLENLSSKESCDVSFYLTDSTKTVAFGKAVVVKK